MKIWEQITPDNWCKGTTARDISTRMVSFNDASAVKWCSLGWIYKVYSPEKSLNHILRFQQVVNSASVSAWNDKPTRTFDQVKWAFKKADL